MGYIPSATTTSGTAYLTEVGRKYLFNKGNVRFDANGVDLFKIVSFTLGDPDENYNSTVHLTTGEIPDISGESESCLKTATDFLQQNIVIFDINGTSLPATAGTTGAGTTGTTGAGTTGTTGTGIIGAGTTGAGIGGTTTPNPNYTVPNGVLLSNGSYEFTININNL